MHAWTEPPGLNQEWLKTLLKRSATKFAMNGRARHQRFRFSGWRGGGGTKVLEHAAAERQSAERAKAEGKFQQRKGPAPKSGAQAFPDG